MRRWLLPVCVVACTCAENTPRVRVDATPSTVFAWRSFRVPPAQFAEANMYMLEGETVTAEYSAKGGPLKWNVHSHPSQTVVIHQEGQGQAGTIVFTPPSDGPFSFIWTNDAGANRLIELTVTLRGKAALDSWVP